MTIQRTFILLTSCFLMANAKAITVSISIYTHALCAYPSGALAAIASGGVGPYSYLWSNGATTQYIEGLTAGTYSVTVIDANLEEASAQIELVSVGYGHSPNPWEFYFWQFGVEPHCSNAWPFGTFFRVNPFGNEFFGPPPYYMDGIELVQDISGNLDHYYGVLPVSAGQDHTFVFSDANGCSGTITVQGVPPIDWPWIVVMDVGGSCTTMPSGSITFAHGAEGFGRMVTYELQGMQGQVSGVSAGMAWYGNAAGTQVITGLLPGQYRLRQRTSGLFNGICYDEHLIIVPDNGPDCGRVTGRAFMDYNLNCTRQGSEPYVPGGIMEVLPGPYYASTDPEDGSYSIILPTGSYTLEQQSNTLDEHCTGGPIPFTISMGQTTTVNLPDTSMVPLDVQVMINSGIARPGFEFAYSTNVRNLTPAASGATSVTFTFDPTLIYLSATPAPSNISGNSITWDQTQLTAFQQRNYTVRFQVPPDIGLLGYQLVATANVSTANTDGNLANNSATNLRNITGAYDPNDKLAYTSSGNTSLWHLGDDEWIDYTIRFQNTGTDTAFTVVITDTLPPNLDPGSIVMGAASHTFTWGLSDQGTLKFFFPNILLPDSNVNEPASHGFVGFRIRPHLPLLPGDEIQNIANIYFDFNPPVITDPSVLVATMGTGVAEGLSTPRMQLMPNPTDGPLVVKVDGLRVLPAVLRVRSMDGRVLMEQRMGATQLQLDVQHLAKGAYFLELTPEHGPGTAVRFVKQ
jgi:uncharacterized repeat protein (TIGR01451 family)